MSEGYKYTDILFDVSKICESILTQAGYEVQLAENGEDALNKMETGGYFPNLLILDLNIPKITGQQVIERLLKQKVNHQACHEQYHIPKIIISTGFSQGEPIDSIKTFWTKELETIPPKILNKPFNRAELLNIVRSTLDE